MSAECLIPHKHTVKILCKSKHFPQRYKRQREWVLFFWTQCRKHAESVNLCQVAILQLSKFIFRAITTWTFSAQQFWPSTLTTIKFHENCTCTFGEITSIMNQQNKKTHGITIPHHGRDNNHFICLYHYWSF